MKEEAKAPIKTMLAITIITTIETLRKLSAGKLNLTNRELITEYIFINIIMVILMGTNTSNPCVKYLTNFILICVKKEGA